MIRSGKVILLAAATVAISMIATKANAADLSIKAKQSTAPVATQQAAVVEMLGTPYFAILDLRPKPLTPATVSPVATQSLGATPTKSKLDASVEVFMIPSEHPKSK